VVVTGGVVVTVVDFAASRSLGFVVTGVDAVGVVGVGVVVGVSTSTVTGMANPANAEWESLARTCACEVVVP
jgi:hypothetical protein